MMCVFIMCLYCFFFFKQKTAYEMRISDWSSDVCSSDLMLDADGYRAMVDSTTQLNRPGAILSGLDGVHAVTDVTGFGLLGHTLEVARASGLSARLRQADLPWLPGVRQLAEQGVVTGASGRNWSYYGASVTLAPKVDNTMRALLCDPPTPGGLLVSCAPELASARKSGGEGKR